MLLSRRGGIGKLGSAFGQESSQFGCGCRIVTASRFARKIAITVELHDIFDRPVSWPVGQLLTRQSRDWRFVALLAVCAVAGGCAACASNGRVRPARRPRGDARPSARGGELLVSVRTEPRTLQPLTRARHRRPISSPSLTQAKLVRINHATQEVEPWLAESWTRSDDGRRVHAEAAAGRHVLRRPPVHGRRCAVLVRGGVRRESRQRLADSLQARRQEAAGRAPRRRRPSSSRFRCRSRRACAFSTTCRSCRSTSSRRRCKRRHVRDGVGPVDAAVGDRRPRPVRPERIRARAAAGLRAQPALLRARRQTAAPLPYLDRADVEIVPDQNAELLRLDVGPDRHDRPARCAPEAYAPLKRAADSGRVKLLDLGVSATTPTACGST